MPLAEPPHWTEGCPSLLLLADYSLGKLPETTVVRVASHLTDCKHCEMLLHESPEVEDSLIENLRRCALGGRTTSDPEQADPGSQATVPDVNALCGATVAGLPARLGQYELLELLGRGGMGVVYKARQVPLNRVVAVKLALGGPVPGTEAFARFQVESEAIARLQHDNIVRVYECGEHDGRPYFSMDYVEGGSLAQKLSGTPLSEREAASLVRTLARAVQFAHRHHIIHRDLKPANVLIGPDGAVKLTDFGLAKFMDAEQGQTEGDAVIGTASYMAPEQARGDVREVGPLADVYGLGAILYEALTGRPPFKASTRAETLEQVRTQDPLSPSRLRPRMSRGLEAVCLKCLAKDPNQRYPSAEALADDLGRWLRGEPTLVQPLSWPRRGLRVVRRHAAKILLALAAAIAPVLLVGGHFWDRNRHLEGTQREPDALREVTFIGQTGPPAWFKPRTRPEDVNISTAPDGAFSVQTSKLALVELLADPLMERYRFSAEVRHDMADRPQGEVGIYFVYSKYNTAQGRLVHYFCGLSFNDLVDIGRYSTRQKLKGNPVQFTIQRCIETKPDPTRVRITRLEHVFIPSPHAWRKVAVEVGPDKIGVFWEGQLIGELSRAELMKSARILRDKPVDAMDVHPHFPSRGGLGIYVHKGSASFREVRIEPLAGEN